MHVQLAARVKAAKLQVGATFVDMLCGAAIRSFPDTFDTDRCLDAMASKVGIRPPPIWRIAQRKIEAKDLLLSAAGAA